MSPSTDAIDRFIEHLERQVRARDRGALAALRRGLGRPPGAASEMHRYVVPWLPADSTDSDAARWYLVASLFALWHQGIDDVATWRGGFGTSFRQLANTRRDGAGMPRDGNGSGDDPAVEKRFMALLASHREDLAEHLRHGVSLLRAEGVGVDWRQLLRDLAWWDSDDRFVQRRWARDFWASTVPASESTDRSTLAPESAQGGNDDR